MGKRQFRLGSLALGLLGVCVLGVFILGVVAVSYGLSNLNHNLNLGTLKFPNTVDPARFGLNEVISADGSTAYLTDPSQNRLVVENVHTGALIADVSTGDTPTGIALTPDGAQVWVSDTELSMTVSPDTSPMVTVIATATNTVVGTIDLPAGTAASVNDSEVLGIAFSPDGSTAYVASNGGVATGNVSIIETATLQVTGSLAPPPLSRLATKGWHPTSVAVNRSGSLLWVSEADFVGHVRGAVSVFDTATGAQVESIPVGDGPYYLVATPKANEAFVADKVSCDITKLDATSATASVLFRVPSRLGCPYGLQVTSDGSMIYAATGNPEIFGSGRSGNSLLGVDVATSTDTVVTLPGDDPVTVTLTPADTTAYVVDARRPSVAAVPLPLTPTTTATNIPVPTTLPGDVPR